MPARASQLLLKYDTFLDAETSLSERALRLWEDKGARIIIGIAGVPGGGKSTTATGVRDRLNSTVGRQLAVLVPMDGFHYYRAQLDAMPDPALAHARRGAPFTFDAAAFVAAVQRLRTPPAAPSSGSPAAAGDVRLPSFDHGAGDPAEDDIVVNDAHGIVLVEGNYVLLDEGPWGQLKALFDESWMLEVDVDTAMANVLRRQVGNGAEPAAAAERVQSNDRPNALLVAASRPRADVIIDVCQAHSRMGEGL